MRHKNSLAYFNLLRILAALSIALIHHYICDFASIVQVQSFYDIFPEPVRWYAVQMIFVADLFFVISGVLFLLIYESRIGTMSFFSFMKKRILRIWPLMITTTVALYLEHIFLYLKDGTTWGDIGTVSFVELAVNCFFGGKGTLSQPLTLNGPAWFVGVLMECYALAFLMAKLSAKWNSMAPYLFPIAVGFYAVSAQVAVIGLNTLVARGFISFFIGVFIGRVIRDMTEDNQTKIRFVCVGMLAVALLVALSGITMDMFLSLSLFVPVMVYPPLFILLYDVRWLNKLCDSAVIKYLGNISFGIYLWDFPIWCLMFLLYRAGFLGDGSGGLPVLFSLMLHLLIGIASYELLEKGLFRKLVTV